MHLRAHVSILFGLALAGCPGPEVLEPATIVTVAGTGLASFDGDGRPPLESGLYAPVQLFFDAQKRPMIVDWNNHRIRAMTSLGLLTTIGNGVEAASPPNELSIAFSVHHPFQFHIAGDGQIYFAGYHDSRAFRVDGNSVVRLVAGNGTAGHSGNEAPSVAGGAHAASFGSPSGIAVGPDGSVYVADESYHDVRRVDPLVDPEIIPVIHHFAGTATSGYSGDGGPASEAALRSPTRLTFDAEGNLYICDTGNHVIRRVGTNGIITTIAGTGIEGYSGDGGPATSAMLNRPLDITMHPDGGFLIADSRNNVIRMVDTAGNIRTVAGNGSEGFGGDEGPALEAMLRVPHSVVVSEDGSLWIADTYNHRIRKVERGY